MTIHLDAGVAWTIEIEAGVENIDADLARTTLARLTLANGASSGTFELPRPKEVVPIEQTAGLDSLEIEIPSDVGLRWSTSAGAGTAKIAGETLEGIAAGTETTTPGFDESGPYYDLRSAAGLGSLVVSYP
ncbi:hypothetical protein GCM10025865_08300 [Paraoerskovia sediminicola]|uniref:Uncharacterized protein n=1 Tax=Paraoerskovia sediminicola TaxID=1138587 RepID=A0ABN6X9M8_9CELL|nr:hypothetical protein [Paraoerskovia sediminicola]BDZ41531.1 hypothetical protein GCM10025865_08300 [Paraoerskovia sediminicola]